MKPLVSSYSSNVYHSHASVLAALSPHPPALLQVGSPLPGMLPSIHHLNPELSLERAMMLDQSLVLKQEPQIYEPAAPKAIPVPVTVGVDIETDLRATANESPPGGDIVQLKAAAVVSHN